MFCSKCGTQNADNNKFCSSCGALLESAQPVVSTQPIAQPVVSTQPIAQQPFVQQQATGYTQYQPAAPVIKAPPVYSTHPVINAVKSIGASPLFIVSAVLFTAYLFFNFLSVVTNGGGLFSGVEDILNTFGLYTSEIYDIFSVIRGGTIAIGLLGMIPTIIVAVGLWVTFAACNDKSNNGLKTSGLTVIKAVSVYNIIRYALLMALIIILGIVVIVQTGNATSTTSYGHDTASSSFSSAAGVIVGTFITIMLIVSAVMGFAIFYQARIVKTINTVKETSITGVPNMSVSAFVAVMSYIFAGVNFIGMCISSGGVLGVFSTLCNIAALICFGILIFKYKNKMQMLMNPALN